MARAYPETQPTGQTTLEVAWQRRSRAQQIPVQFVTSQPAHAELPRPTVEELTWLPRHELGDDQEQS